MVVKRRLGGRLHSVRARATIGAVAVVAVALILGGIGFLAVLHFALVSSARSAAESEAESISDSVATTGMTAIAQLDDDSVVQIVDANGNILSSTAEAQATNLAKATSPVLIDDDLYYLVTEDVDNAGSTVWLGYEPDTDAVGVVAQLLLIAVPLLVGLVGAVTWIVTGSALKPVQKIRAEVDAINTTALHKRVQVPATEDEIAALAATMNRMLERLDQGARTQRQFVSDASHELRSPLATIRQHAELASSHPELLSNDELSSVVLAEGHRMQDLVDSLLLLARLDESQTASWEAVDLDDIALSEVSRLRTASVRVDSSGIAAARVLGDLKLLSQVARNLVDNALRHAEHQIAISVHSDDSVALFIVEDDGAGVPSTERKRIFERFVRLDESRTRDAGGTGLGLAIVHSIVSTHGGSITVDESRWQGARFTVTIPLATQA